MKQDILRVAFQTPVMHHGRTIVTASLGEPGIPKSGIVTFASITLDDVLGFPCFVLTGTDGRVTRVPFSHVAAFVMEEPKPEEPKPEAPKAPLKK